MPLKKLCLVGICTNSIFFLTSQVASAFSFTLPSPTPLPCEPGASFYCAKHQLVLPGTDGGAITTQLKPITNLTLGGTNSFLEDLKNSTWGKNGWQFQSAETNLFGSFEIGVYNAYATLTRVGANIQISYQPGENDPTGTNVHWIQRVVNNHVIEQTLQGIQNLGHGTSENSIDVIQEQTDPLFLDANNPQKQTFNPFYDTYSEFANQTFFEDFTGRPDITEDHNWYAELYLVQEIAPKTVVIYNGISWGWENIFTPRPSPPISLPPLPCDGSSGGGGCVTTASDILIRELPVSDFDSSDPIQSAEKVPEPTTIFGLLALGVAGTIEIFKNKFNQQ